jgi:hypothetical protein
LLVSMLTAAYGAWPFDLVLLLVPVVQAATQVQRHGRRGVMLAAGLIYVTLNGVAALQLAWQMEYLAFVWMTPALLFTYVAVSHLLGADSR